MIFAGLLFFKEQFVLKKFIGAFLIIFSNVLIFYNRKSSKVDKSVIFGVLACLAFSIALFLDVNISNDFNLAFYVALSLLVPALFIIIFEKIKLSSVISEFKNGNKLAIIITGLCSGTTLIVKLKAYQLGEVTTIAPLLALTVLGNVITGYIFLDERSNLLKKVIAAIIIMISIILIKT
jgi:drug/metabolite transporter (DMT)-like permease